MSIEKQCDSNANVVTHKPLFLATVYETSITTYMNLNKGKEGYL